MSQSLGSWAVFGVILSESAQHYPGVWLLYQELVKEIGELKADVFILEYDGVLAPLFIRLRERYKEAGIVLPEEFTLFYTGPIDEHGGGTQAEQWVLGLSLYSDPREYATLDSSFVTISSWHTWITIA